MPTGYTHAVYDGSITELAPFAMQLARGMGALITMRDDPSDAPVPERFEPSDYRPKRIAELEAGRAAILALTDDEANTAAEGEFVIATQAMVDAEEEHHVRRARYQAMLDKVRAWVNPPEGLREFAIQQLEQSLEFDCREPFKYWGAAPVRKTGREWREAQIAKFESDLAYQRREYEKERDRVEGSNQWIAQLRRSLAASEAAS